MTVHVQIMCIVSLIYNIFILLFILTVDFEHKTEGNLWISDWNDDHVRPVPAIVYRNYIKMIKAGHP